MERLADQTGLRFDFREHVRLPDDLPAIGALEQVELVPFTEEMFGRDGPRLKGHLELTAVYAAGGEDGATRSFTHRIPVDISLPVRAAGDGPVRIEIGEFDVEPDTDRSLNVTGVVTLTGLAPERSETGLRNDPPETGEGDIVAVHRARKKKPASDEVQVIPQDVPASAAGDGPVPDTPDPASGGVQDAVPAQAGHEPSGAPAGDWPTGADDPADAGGQDALPASANPHEADDPPEDGWTGVRAEGLPGTEEAAEPSAAEPKVAFKPMEESPAEDRPAAEASSKAGSNNNELEWRKLFLTGEGEESFRKLRLCIVQKEETIDTIAERYRLNPREIALYNRLTDGSVSEGQILYIPLP